jgi:PAS domain-containing protein
MAQKPVELILMRQLASYLAVPIFLVDPQGTLLYYNEPAERLLGRRYDETGEMPLAEWSTAFAPAEDDGTPLPADALPLSVAVQKRVASYRGMRIRGADGVERRIAVTAFPLEGQGARLLGAVAIFWEQPGP